LQTLFAGERMQSYVKRFLDIKPLLSRSVFLLGPRQTGKSTYLRHELHELISGNYNLLDRSVFLNLSRDLTRIRKEVLANHWEGKLIIIDEIQKLPELLDEVQLMIEELNVRFILTGSSARKLKRAGTNLLGGRARVRHFYPLTSAELGKEFDLDKAIYRGLLPAHYFSDLPDEDLNSYIGQYLSEEIASEGASRNIPAFARFLEVAATCNTRLVDATSVASDAQVSRQTAQNYFQILLDTLLGFYLPPFLETVKRKSIGTPKFYFFDMGIVRFLRNLGPITKNSSDFGEFLEHFIFLEIRAYLDYLGSQKKLSYWQSRSKLEVDFLIGRDVAIEVKSTANCSAKHLKGLKALLEEGLSFKKYCLVCFEESKQVTGEITIYPWRLFLEELWAGKIVHMDQNFEEM
jgi:predicted AAA+ superfamily ATPase